MIQGRPITKALNIVPWNQCIITADLCPILMGCSLIDVIFLGGTGGEAKRRRSPHYGMMAKLLNKRGWESGQKKQEKDYHDDDVIYEQPLKICTFFPTASYRAR